jgi:DNA-binding XRE family transcriptional regulator
MLGHTMSMSGYRGPLMRLNKEDIVRIRKSCGLSQTEFSKMFRVPYGTLTAWEQGYRTPGEISCIYLRLIHSDPDRIDQMVQEMYKPKVPRKRLEEAA